MSVVTKTETSAEKVVYVERSRSVSTRLRGRRLAGFALAAAAVAVLACAPNDSATNPEAETSGNLEVVGEIVLEGLEVVLSDADVDLSIPAFVALD